MAAKKFNPTTFRLMVMLLQDLERRIKKLEQERVCDIEFIGKGKKKVRYEWRSSR
jgi:hypothetical protein